MLYLDALLDVIAYTDPASGKTGEQIKRTKARQALIVIGQDAIGRVFVLQAWAARLSTPEYVNVLMQADQTWHPKRFGIEANAMQVLFGDTVKMIAELQGFKIPFEPIYQPTNIKKEWRNRTRLQPFTASGRLFLQENQHELKAELLGHPNYPTCDLVDALATACSILPARQHENRRMDDDLKNLAAYLRETGAPPSYIKQRIEELRQERFEHTLISLAQPIGGNS